MGRVPSEETRDLTPASRSHPAQYNAEVVERHGYLYTKDGEVNEILPDVKI